MGGMGAALSGAASAVGSGVKSLGEHVASGAKSLYGDEKNYLQTGSPTQPGQDPTMTQALLFGQQPQQETPASKNRRTLAMQQ